MNLNHGLKTMLSAGLAAALLAGSALAAPITAVPANADTTKETLQPICVYGKATAISKLKDGSSILLENSNDNDPYQKVEVIVSDKTMILDAVSGDTKTMKDIKQNDSLYAYVGPAMTRSIPPQANATLILCNIPADFAVPKYAEVLSVSKTDDGIDVLMTGSVILHLNKDTKLLAHLTDNIIKLSDITVGAHLLSWYAIETLSMPGQASPDKVMLFPKAQEAIDPTAIITRGEFIELLYASVKSPTVEPAAPFTDIDSDAIIWAHAQNIAAGTGKTAFNPDDALTREQFMAFLLRYATALNKGPVGSWAVRITYTDAANIAPWASSGAMWNEITKLVTPDDDNNILPSANVTIAEAVAAIKGLLSR